MGSSEGGNVMNQTPRQYGVTKPISTAGPTDVDVQRSVELEKFLVDAGLYESQEEAVRREEVLGQINQIERDTYEMLQCHPYPNEYVDSSKHCAHCAFFMGLQRKQGVRVQEGQQFDIRGTVDEFRQSVNMYMYWKPGMEIYVSHVRRRQIPSFVLPEGFKRSRPSKPASQQKSERAGGEDGDDEVEGGGSLEKRFKMKTSPDDDVGKQ